MLADGAVEPQGTGEQRFAAQLRQRQIGPIAVGATETTYAASICRWCCGRDE